MPNISLVSILCRCQCIILLPSANACMHATTLSHVYHMVYSPCEMQHRFLGWTMLMRWKQVPWRCRCTLNKRWFGDTGY